MNAITRMSGKGQVVIPKDVRDRLRLALGDVLDVVERPDGVFLRKRRLASAEDFVTITARIRARVRYAGPPVSIADMGRSIDDMWAGGGARWDK